MPTRRLALKASITLHDPATVLSEPTVCLAAQPRPQRRERRPATDLTSIAQSVPLAPDGPPGDPPLLQSAFLAQPLNQPVTVHLRSGLIREGTLKQADPFTLRLQIPAGNEVLIFRHLIERIVPTHQ